MTELHDLLARFLNDLLARPSGPLAFRFVLQPLMAAALALRDGVNDARTGQAPYFASVLRGAGRRGEQLAAGLKATGRVLALALVLDAAYQLVVLRHFYPDEAIVVALALGFVPYLLLRGPVDRIARRRPRRPSSQEAARFGSSAIKEKSHG